MSRLMSRSEAGQPLLSPMEGTFDFDNNAGRVTNSHVTEKIVMLISIMNNDIDQDSDSTTDMKLVPAR